MFAFPAFVSVDVCDVEVFRSTFPKLRLVGFAVSVSVVTTPVPLRLMARGDGVPFVVRVTDPLTVPGDAGEKMALNVKLLPAAIVDDVAKPLMLIPAPATAIFEKVSVTLPSFVSVIDWELLFPTTTFEKPTLAGDAATCACIPVPVSEIVAGEPGALLLI